MSEVRTEMAEANVGGVQVSLQSVYLKDSSYESPNGPRLPNNQGWEPKFQLNMNTSAEDIGPDVREVLLRVDFLIFCSPWSISMHCSPRRRKHLSRPW